MDSLCAFFVFSFLCEVRESRTRCAVRGAEHGRQNRIGKGGITVIKLEHVDKYFGDLHVLKDVNLEVAEGEKLVIIGPSGSGKSTTVRCMNFLEEPTSGHVYIDGQELTNKNKTRIVRDNMSMVFQQFNLYPHMTVLEKPDAGTHEAPSQDQGRGRRAGISLS